MACLPLPLPLRVDGGCGALLRGLAPNSCVAGPVWTGHVVCEVRRPCKVRKRSPDVAETWSSCFAQVPSKDCFLAIGSLIWNR